MGVNYTKIVHIGQLDVRRFVLSTSQGVEFVIGLDSEQTMTVSSHFFRK